MDEEYSAKKVGFDARIQYYDVLKEKFHHHQATAMYGDIEYSYRTLRRLFHHMVLGIEDINKRTEIKKRLDKLKNMIASSRRYPYPALYKKITSELEDIELELTLAARNMLLPFGEDEEKEIDWSTYELK